MALPCQRQLLTPPAPSMPPLLPLSRYGPEPRPSTPPAERMTQSLFPPPQPQSQLHLQLAPPPFTKIPRTACFYKDRIYMNQTWLNLSSCIKILLLALLQKSKLSLYEAMNFLLLDYNEREDWKDLCHECELVNVRAKEKAEIRKEKKMKKLLKDGRKGFTFKERLEMKEDEEAGRVAFMVTQSDVDEGRRFLLCRCENPVTWLIRNSIADGLDEWVGRDFTCPLSRSRL